ncbi:ATP-binding protein [Kordiimonas aquimaris]|uniref:ATP-binding protein n=1 Tax=Kordiimonas aquimaris TaxID=707591 RepID=UPI0021CFCCB4|nr:ATP-binding protein [Kordiimonas aquimaris]
MSASKKYMEGQVKEDAALRVKRSIDRIYSQQLSKILLVVIAYYSFITVSHYFFIAEDIRAAVMFVSTLTALSSSLVYFLIRAHLLRHSQTHAAFIPVGLIAIAAVYTHIFLTEDQLQLTNGILILFAFGFLTLSRRVFTLFFVISSALYIGVLLSMPGPYTAHFAFMYLAAGALGVLCFVLRYRTTHSAQRLLVANRHKTSQLVMVSKQMQKETEQAQIAAASAEQANKAKDAFLANTTHELRTPLTGVLGMLDLLDDTGLTKQQEEAVTAAKFSARTLLVVINDLLDLAKIDAGTFELKALPFSLQIVTRHVADLLRPQAEAKGLMLNVIGLDAVDTPLIGDPVRIGQILLNLLDNAIKFTEQGAITVSIKSLPATSETKGASGNLNNYKTVSVMVRDTGVGFDAEDWGRLFARFEQLDNSATRQAEGAGLGLSICQSIAKHMNGNIVVDSVAGQGSEFTFAVTLPVAHDIEDIDLGLVSRPAILTDVQKPEQLVDNRIVDDHQSKTSENDSVRILLAEDNRINQMLVKKLAGKFNWSLDIAENGEAAVRCVEENLPYDLILMDIRMPEMDGVTATKIIKKMPPFRANTPIVALTANTSEEDTQTYIEAGMLTVIGKPVDAKKLKQEVDKVITAKVHF